MMVVVWFELFAAAVAVAFVPLVAAASPVEDQTTLGWTEQFDEQVLQRHPSGLEPPHQDVSEAFGQHFPVLLEDLMLLSNCKAQ